MTSHWELQKRASFLSLQSLLGWKEWSHGLSVFLQQYSIRLQAILRPPRCSNTAPFLPCLPYSCVQARSDLSLSRNRQGRKSKIWSHAFLKALRRTPAPKSLQVQRAVISAHQVLSRHKEAVQLQVHEKHCSSLSDLSAKHKTQTLQGLSLKRSKCLKMKNKCFYL